MTAVAVEDRERVGPYRVIRAIGAGGTARIDLARVDRAYGFQRHVVLKRPLEHLRGDPGVAASLRREARLGGRLRHPNLVAILDAGVHEGYDYLALEYVHGAALRSVMHAGAPGAVRELPLAVALAIVSDAARGLHEAHELTDEGGAPLGLVHRDVSPGNVLLGMDGAVKLADFGIAKETRVATLSGSMHGTVTYMAPEQCQGHAFDRRADVFSLGVILYELVTATRLFWADNDVASLHRVLSGTVPRPRKLRPALPAALEDIVLTAVAHDPGKRFPTALALATAIERFAASAGEVIGARWVARTMREVIGPRPVPWSAAPSAVEAVAVGDSLVELIAAAPDEPVDPTFGEGDVATEREAAAVTRRRGGRWAAAVLAAAVGGGALAYAVARTEAGAARAPGAAAAAGSAAATETAAAAESTTAAATAAATESAAATGTGSAARSATGAAAATGTAAATGAAAATGPAAATRAAAATVAGAGPAASSSATTNAVSGTPGRRRPRGKHGVSGARTVTAERRTEATGAANAAGSASAAGSAADAAVAPAPQPAAAVEWKPTLLLPTDGSAHR